MVKVKLKGIATIETKSFKELKEAVHIYERAGYLVKRISRVNTDNESIYTAHLELTINTGEHDGKAKKSSTKQSEESTST